MRLESFALRAFDQYGIPVMFCTPLIGAGGGSGVDS